MTPEESRARFLSRIGPHLAVTEFRWVDRPASHGIAPYRDRVANTACGKVDTPSTLATPRVGSVRCPACLATLAAP